MMKILCVIALGSVVGVAACSRPADGGRPAAAAAAETGPAAQGTAVETIPVGSEVEVVRRDGTVVRGTLAGRDTGQLKLDGGAGSRSVPRAEIARVRLVDPTRPATLPALPTFHEFTLAEGTRLRLRLSSSIASDTSRVEDPVEATLIEAVVLDRIELFPAGSVVHGEVSAVERAGKVKGRASLSLRFTSVDVAGREERSSILARMTLRAPATKRKDAAKIGIPAAGGAILGGIFGGKKGAAIGGTVGGGGGTAVVLSTSGDEVRLARGATLTVTLGRPSKVRIPTNGS